MTMLATRMLRDPFFADFFGQFLGATGNRVTGWVPTVDVRETDDEYVVFVDLPGVKGEDVSIELENDLLTISGTRVAWQQGEARLVERPYGSFTRTLTLPKGIDPDQIVAEYGDGVLTLHVPKPAQQKRRIAIGSGTQQQAIEA